MSKSYTKGQRKAYGKGDAEFRRTRKSLRRQQILKGGDDK
jgi:hypothetical protein